MKKNWRQHKKQVKIVTYSHTVSSQQLNYFSSRYLLSVAKDKVGRGRLNYRSLFVKEKNTLVKSLRIVQLIITSKITLLLPEKVEKASGLSKIS